MVKSSYITDLERVPYDNDRGIRILRTPRIDTVRPFTQLTPAQCRDRLRRLELYVARFEAGLDIWTARPLSQEELQE